MSSVFSPEVIASLLPILKGRNEGLVPFYEADLTGTATSVTFDSISQDFKHLVMFGKHRTDNASIENVKLFFNNDTTANYDVEVMYGAASTPYAVSSAGTAVPIVSVTASSASTANNFGQFFAVIPNYTGAQNKDALSIGGVISAHGTTSGYFIQTRIVHWRSTSAISRIDFVPQNGPNFVSGTHFSIWGIGTAR